MREEVGQLPGAELVYQGLVDLSNGVLTAAALLVACASSRLRRAGFSVATCSESEPRLMLYALLAKDEPETAHSRFNALFRRLESFEHAVEAVNALHSEGQRHPLGKLT